MKNSFCRGLTCEHPKSDSSTIPLTFHHRSCALELQELFFNARYSDLEIICQHGFRFKVHRVVIALHSPTLNALVSKGLNANGQVVSQIELPDVDYTTLYMMLQFSYGGNYYDYETVGSFHAPASVVFMKPEDIEASLKTLPFLHMELTTEGAVVDGHEEMDTLNNEEDEEGTEDESGSDWDAHSEASQDREHHREEDRDYCLATRFHILPLQLLARDRFYRTAEKVLTYPFNMANGQEATWRTHDHQRIYRSKLAKAVFDDFPRVVRELYQTVPESDTAMHAIPPMLITAGYNSDEFRDHMKPLLEEYPELALAVVECMRVPNSEE
ncbi:hypothetical protein F5Y07DRAFT_406823 [Xylaria sp. FL0933]|nr:hypothetical protein F5Y07DRAFT_406823 [Xylaria sp. FL0933]